MVPTPLWLHLCFTPMYKLWVTPLHSLSQFGSTKNWKRKTSRCQASPPKIQHAPSFLAFHFPSLSFCSLSEKLCNSAITDMTSPSSPLPLPPSSSAAAAATAAAHTQTSFSTSFECFEWSQSHYHSFHGAFVCSGTIERQVCDWKQEM